MIGTMQRSLGIFITVLFLILTFAFTAMATDISLKWDPNTESDLAGYQVYVGVGTNKPEDFKMVKQTTGTSTDITKLDNTKSHSFAVTAVNTAGIESGFSNIVTIPAAPAVPGNLNWTVTVILTGKVQ